MEASDNCIALVKQFEGFSATPYADSAGFNSIGYGHKIRTGEAFHAVTEEEAEQLLRDDLKDAEAAVNEMVTVDLTQNEFDALVDFVFNLGGERLRKSTLLKLLNRGDYGGASEEFAKWSYAAGVQLKGLKTRREAEKRLFLTPGAD